jgi:hypothetical protein
MQNPHLQNDMGQAARDINHRVRLLHRGMGLIWRWAPAHLGWAIACASAQGTRQVTVESSGAADNAVTVVVGSVQECARAAASPREVVVVDCWRLDGVVELASLSVDLRRFNLTKMTPGDVEEGCNTHVGSTVYIFDDWGTPVVPPGRVLRVSRLEAIYRHWARVRPEVLDEVAAIIVVGSATALVGRVTRGDTAGRVECEVRGSSLGAIWATGRGRLPRGMRSEGPQTVKELAAVLAGRRNWTSTPKATPGFCEDDARALLRLADPYGECQYIIISAWAGVPAIESVIRAVCPSATDVLVSQHPFRDAYSGVLMSGVFRSELGTLSFGALGDVDLDNTPKDELASVATKSL